VASASAEAVEVARAADVAVDGPAGVVELLSRLADAVAGPGAADPGEGDAGDAVRSRRR